MVSDRLLKLSQPLERRLNVKYEELKMKHESPNITSYANKHSSSFYYDRLSSLAEPRYRREKYVNPENGYNNNKVMKSNNKFSDRLYYNTFLSSSVTETNNKKYFDKLLTPLKNGNDYERNVFKRNTSKMEESDQVTRMNRKTYVAVASNEGKSAKQLARERLQNLATPRYRREKYIDSNLQYDVTYQSQVIKKLSQMNKQSSSSSPSSQNRYASNKEVLQLAEDTPLYKKHKNDEITEIIIPKYLRKQPYIDNDSTIHSISKSLNNKSFINENNNDDDIFNIPFVRTTSELRFLNKQIILSRKFKNKVPHTKKFPTTILWHISKSKKKRRQTSKKQFKNNTINDVEKNVK